MQIPHILVVGGAGYIGSHMVWLLGQRGARVTVLDNLSTGHRDAVLCGRLVEGDMADADLLGSLFGACIIGMLEAGIISAGLDGFWTRLVYGVMILAALMIHGSMLQLQQGRWRSRFFK